MYAKRNSRNAYKEQNTNRKIIRPSAERKDKNLRSAGLLYIRISIVSGLIREIP